ncbi:MAG TPA: methyltransferase domain-containing protein [Bacteroidota bacterium]|nr:methyltransferase domain-containing protein [Bacteroidota bacterium]
MNRFIPARRFDERILEMMDDPNADATLLRDELKNLRRINKFFGGLSAIRESVFELAQELPVTNPVRILDLGTGSADLPIHLVECAANAHREFHVTAVENNPIVFDVARERTRQFPAITVERGNILSLAYPPQSFDIVLCSLTLHHFSHQQITRIIASMNDLSRIGIIINDLRRSWPAAWTAKLYSLLTTRNPMTIYDGYLSVLRGFTREELRRLAHAAGVHKFEIRTRPLFRLLLLGMR